MTRIGRAILFAALAALGTQYAAPRDADMPLMTRDAVGMSMVREAFDRTLGSDAAAGRIAGAVGVAVMPRSDGDAESIELAYGYADVAAGLGTDCALTRFRIGSVTKTFTALAVLQLAERGTIDLDADIEEYVGPIGIGRYRGGPVTAARLLTNTAGFGALDESAPGQWIDGVPVPGALPGLEETVLRLLPPRVAAGGEVVIYSNFGFALLGLLIEKVSGLAYGDYLERNVFGPLGMADTDAFLDPSNLPFASKEYEARRGVLGEAARGETALYPAGSIVSTARDMGRYISFLCGEPSAVLSEAGIALMLSPRFSHHPLLSPYGYGFYRNESRESVYEHLGDIGTFASYLCVDRGARRGFFVSVNTSREDGDSRDDAVRAAHRALEALDYSKTGVGTLAAGHTPVAARLGCSGGAETRGVNGFYKYSGTPTRGAGRIKYLAFMGARVRETADGSAITLSIGGQKTRMARIGPGVFKAETGGDAPGLAIFMRDESGRTFLVRSGPAPRQAGERVGGAEAVAVALLPAFIAAFPAALALSVLALILRRSAGIGRIVSIAPYYAILYCAAASGAVAWSVFGGVEAVLPSDVLAAALGAAGAVALAAMAVAATISAAKRAASGASLVANASDCVAVLSWACAATQAAFLCSITIWR